MKTSITSRSFPASLLLAGAVIFSLSAQAALDDGSMPAKLTAGSKKARAGTTAAAVVADANDTTKTETTVLPASVSGAATTDPSTDEGQFVLQGQAETKTADGAAAAKIDTSKLSEKEIPVLTTLNDPKKSSGSQFLRLMMTLGVLLVGAGAATFGLKRWSKNAKSQAQKNTRIKILTQHHLGPKKSLAIVQVAGETILVGITDQNISMLKTLALLDEEIPEAGPQNFNNAMDEYEDEEEAPRSRGSRQSETREQEDFTMRGLSEIRDTVSSRLKNMRNL